MSENDLLNEGIEAARAGDKDKARKLFEQVLEKDDENVKAWLLLSRVVDDLNEKRICLTTVLQLDPSNQRAKEMLEKLDAKAEKAKGDEEVIPGISRRQMTLIGGIVGGVLIVLILIVAVITISGNNQRAAAESATRQAAAAATAVIETGTSTALTAEALVNQNATETAAAIFAIASPTPTITPTSDAPPTWTFTPSHTPPVTATPLPFPDGIPGSIIAWSGLDIQNNDYLPVVVFPLAARGQGTRVGQQFGRYPAISPDGQQVIYTRYYPTTFDFGLERININGSQPEDLGQMWRNFAGGLQKAEMGTYSVNGDQIVFVAIPGGSSTPQVYLLNLAVAGGIQRLTTDAATYTFPALSPDGTKVVAVRNDKLGAQPGEDLVVIDIATMTQTPITTDFGGFIESSPRWSLDGRTIAYASALSTELNNFDIVIRNSDGSGTPTLPVRSPANDIYPVFSPDGRFIAFSSNRTGSYDIFIFEVATGALYQLTSTEDEDYPGGWSFN